MIITELIRSIGEKVFLPFVALCIVGVFSSVSFAEEATTNKPASATPAAGTPHSTPPGKIERAGQSTGKGIERAANATKRGVKRACEATGKGIKKAGEAIEKTFSGKD
jgi:acetyl-CoA acetyltransferase